jgi:hypothetical protein
MARPFTRRGWGRGRSNLFQPSFQSVRAFQLRSPSLTNSYDFCFSGFPRPAFSHLPRLLRRLVHSSPVPYARASPAHSHGILNAIIMATITFTSSQVSLAILRATSGCREMGGPKDLWTRLMESIHKLESL